MTRSATITGHVGLARGTARSRELVGRRSKRAAPYDKARDIYLENKDTRLFNGRSFREHVFEDFRRFRAEGLIHSDMDRIERLLQAPAEP